MTTPQTRYSIPKQVFPVTSWTLVEEARAGAGDDDADGSLAALHSLCLSYWYPLYSWARHSGWNEEDARDLIQSFFERLLEKRFLDSADPAKGKLRTFLLVCLKRHGNDLREKAWAAKRDARMTISLDFEWAEGRYHDPVSPSPTPDRLYDKRWAHTLLHYALETLEEELSNSDQEDEFEALKPFLGFQSRDEMSYLTVAQQLGVSESAIKSRIFRLRKRFQELLLQQARLTLDGDEDPKAELMTLIGAV